MAEKMKAAMMYLWRATFFLPLRMSSASVNAGLSTSVFSFGTFVDDVEWLVDGGAVVELEEVSMMGSTASLIPRCQPRAAK